MDVQSLKLSPRSVTGKKVKQLRRQDIVPVHVYGRDQAPSALQAEGQVLRRILPQVGTNVPLSLEVEGEDSDNICFVREVQRHPVTEDILHVDFLRVDVALAVRAEVPVILTGNPPAVRDLGGTLLQQVQTIMVESLPMNVPLSIEMDVSELDDFEKAVYVREVTVASGVTIITDSDELIARVSPPRIEVEEEVETGLEDALEEDGEAPDDGEQAAEGRGEGGASTR